MVFRRSPLRRRHAYHEEAPDWALLNDSRQIERTFWFADFGEALSFVQRVGDLAESERHHPDMAFSSRPIW